MNTPDQPLLPPTPGSIRALLDAAGVHYRHIEHGATFTSEESAAARGEPLEIGAKALLIKVDASFELYVLSAAKRLDSAAVKRARGARSARFATREELLALTGLVPGSVPPFGRPLLPFDLNVDCGIDPLPRVAFNAASLTESLVMSAADYLRVASPSRVFPFAT